MKRVAAEIFACLAITVGLAACGNSGSSAAVTPPQVVNQPANQTADVGQTATFSATATGSAPLRYQWQKAGSAIAGATNSSYTTPATSSGDNGSSFSVVVSNSAGSVTSNPATLTVLIASVAPQITSQPVSQTADAGATASFSVTAIGTQPLQYQWLKNGIPVVGANSAGYTTPVTSASDSGTIFTVIVTNAAGSATSSVAKLTVVVLPAAPQINTQPVSPTVNVGQIASFSVTASGTAPLGYQWLKNGAVITGATHSSYTTPPISSSDNGSIFTVIVTNAIGSVTSNAAVLTAVAVAGTDVLTYKFDAMRSGQNLTEAILTPSNVTSATFGKLRNLSVDGLVDAQPLYLSQLLIAGSKHNVVYVATEHDSVYAFDADTGITLWQTSLIGTAETTSDDRGCGQVTPEIGVTSTPVIDRSAGPNGTIFVVAMTKDAASNYHQRLHALDITSGKELSASPVEMAASFGATSFAPGQYKERAALLLINGTIYTTWASHCDIGPYGGWVIALNEATLKIATVLNLALGASGSGLASQGPSIWMSGGGPAADASGNVYVLTANGRFDTSLTAGGFPSSGDYGNSFVKMSAANGTLAVADYFTMSGEVAESTDDVDLGSGGILLLPDLQDGQGIMRQLAVGAGKDGNLYVVDRNNMGKFTSVGNSIWQQLNGVLGAGVWATPAYYASTVYYGPQGGPLLAFSLTKALLSSSPTSQTATQFVYPGTFPVVSAKGAENAIVWAYENTSPAVLHAYAAGNLASELYNSNQAANGRDQFGTGNKYIAPVVADGKVFVATTNSVAVFGLLP